MSFLALIVDLKKKINFLLMRVKFVKNIFGLDCVKCFSVKLFGFQKDKRDFLQAHEFTKLS